MSFAFFSKIKKTGNPEVDMALAMHAVVVSQAETGIKDLEKQLRTMRHFQSKTEEFYKKAPSMFESRYKENQSEIESLESKINDISSSTKYAKEQVADSLKEHNVYMKDRQLMLSVYLDRMLRGDSEKHGFMKENGTFDAEKFHQNFQSLLTKHGLSVSVDGNESENEAMDKVSWGIYNYSEEREYDGKLKIVMNFDQRNIHEVSDFLVCLAEDLNSRFNMGYRDNLAKSHYDYLFRNSELSREEQIDIEIQNHDDYPFTMVGNSLNYYGDISKGRSLSEILAEYKNSSHRILFQDFQPHFEVDDSTPLGKEINTYYSTSFGSPVDGVNGGHTEDGYDYVSKKSAQAFLEQNPELRNEAQVRVQKLRMGYFIANESNENGMGM